MSDHSVRRWSSGAMVAFSVPLILCSSASALGQHGSEPATPIRSYTTDPVNSAAVPQWREDLKTLVEALERVHPQPYQQTSKVDFDREVARLHESIPQLAEHEIVVAFARLLALVGDGHTSLPLYFAAGVDFHVLPYRLGVYDDAIYVEAADRAHKELVGRELIAIGGIPASEALARVTRLISRDNDNWIRAVSPNLLNRIEVLHALGLSPDLEGADLTVQQPAGPHTERVRRLERRLPAAMGLPFLPSHADDWVDARDHAGTPPPLYQRRFDDNYWWQYLPESDLLYIKFDQVQNRSAGATALETFREAMAFARETRPSRTVIDIRNNTGGNGSLLPPIIREIVATRESDQHGKLFLVIGRRTFSAAQMMTGWMELFTSAILVGEPSSAVYNGYAGHEFVRLPNSGVQVAISPDYYQMGSSPRDRRRQATPKLSAVPTFDDYLANRDPALAAILAYPSGESAIPSASVDSRESPVNTHGARSGVAGSRLGSYVGAYRVAPDGTMSLSRFVHDGNEMYLFTDFTHGWRGVLQPAAGDTFDVVGSGGVQPTGQPRVLPGRDAQGRRVLELHTSVGPVRIGRQVAFRTDSVRFRSDTVSLAGEIVLPPGPGPHPGIVFVHGSGPATRNDYREWSYYFAANGLAVLIYDKRGAGNSTGDYRRASFHDLAYDALAAVRTLRNHRDVASDKVGLSGGSQGAWVSPIAENKDGRLAFLIPTGGGPITPATQEIYRRARLVQDSGYAEQDVTEARQLVTLYFDYLGTGGENATLARRVSDAWRQHSGAAWFPLLDLPSRDPTVGEWPEGRKRFARELHFDPTPFTAAVKTPTLAILGAEDQGFPTTETAAAYHATVPPDMLTVWIIPGVDHGFWVRDDKVRGQHQSPALFHGMLAWIQRQFSSGGSASKTPVKP